jgi:hypothetical protein
MTDTLLLVFIVHWLLAWIKCFYSAPFHLMSVFKFLQCLYQLVSLYWTTMETTFSGMLSFRTWNFSLKFCFCFCFTLIYLVTCVHATSFVWGFEDNLWEPILSFQLLGSGRSNPGVRLNDKHLYPRNHLDGWLEVILWKLYILSGSWSGSMYWGFI